MGTTQRNVSRWELGLTTPGPYFRARLSELFGKSAEELDLKQANATTRQDMQETGTVSAEPFLLWTVPYRPNPHFTGRDDLLEQLDRHLSLQEDAGDPRTTRCAALTQPQAIWGLGGIGKTQIALEYASRTRAQGRYSHILWVNAATEEAIQNSVVALAQRLPGVLVTEQTNQNELIAAALHWLEQCQERWLLIFDNADDLALLPAYLPHEGRGHILLTTRATAVAFLAVSVEVSGMHVQEGIQFLLHRTQRLHATERERHEARQIVLALEGFPLALDQAGAYIEETRCSFGDYLHLYQDHRHMLLARRGKQTTGYPASVATTWSLSFQQVEAANPAAADLLRLCAFLQPDSIPEALLQEGAKYWPSLLQQEAGDLLRFNQMVEDLLIFSLIKRLTEDHRFGIHRLVQAILQDAMSQEGRQQWTERVVRALEHVFPVDSQSMERWDWCEQLVSHVTHLTEAPGFSGDPLVLASLWYKTARFLHYRSSYAEAEALHQRVLTLREQQEDLAHETLLEPLIGLVEATWYLGKLEAATHYAQRAMTILERVQGTRRFALIKPLNILAHVARSRGQVDEAERLLVNALTIWVQFTHQELTGIPSAPEQEEERPDRAALLQQTFALLQQTSLSRHLDAGGQALAALAQVYLQQRRYPEAEHLLKTLRQHAIAVLGEAHPMQATLLMLQGKVEEETGQTEQAAHHYAQALNIRETMLGTAHPHTQEAATAYRRLHNAHDDQQTPGG